MKIVAFTTELHEKIDSKDLLIVRNLYQPKIGQLATSLYHLLVDHDTINNSVPEWTNFQDLAKTLDTNLTDLEKALKTLGASGLIRKWENMDSVKVVIRINKPQKPSDLRNSLLSSIHSSKISETRYERIEMFLEKRPLVKKDGFQENTARFQDVFELKNDTFQKNTLVIADVEPKSIQEAIVGLTSPAFVKFITNMTCSPSILENINLLRQYGFSSESINLLNNYSYDINGKIVVKYVNKIAEDMLSKKVVGAREIRLELASALKSRNTTKLEVQNRELYEPTMEETMEWEDLVEEIGDF